MTAPAEPHEAADARFARLDAMHESALKSTKCRDCPHCRHWRVDVGGASVEAGFCPWQDVPLSHADLEASVWDACGDAEGAVWG